MTRDRCVECGHLSELVLPSRFPHVCHECLFPVGRPADPRAGAPSMLQALSITDRLQSLSGNGRWLAGLDRPHKRLPESLSRRRWDQ